MERNTGYPENDPLSRHNPDHGEISKLCEEFGLGDLICNHGDLGGLYNVNLKIETNKGMYVIRIASGLASERHLRFSKQVIDVLHNANIPVLKPIVNEQGMNYSTYKDRFVQITPYIEAYAFQTNPRFANASGRILRKMHDTLENAQAGPLPEWSNYPSSIVLEEGMSLLKDVCRVPHNQLSSAEQFYNLVMNEWEKLCHDLPETIIHGDWHMWNALYDTNGEVRAVLDFDFVQRAERIHDVAYMMWALLPNDSFPQLGSAFLQGYGELSDIEKRILPVAIARASVFFICTSSFNPVPTDELERQLTRQGPFIEWLLSNEGRRRVADLLSATD